MRYRQLGTAALLLLLGTLPSGADETPSKLLGPVSEDQLAMPPYAEWFTSGYEHYSPDAGVVEALREQALDEFRFTVFFGTWCSDSRREVPRLLKLLDALGVADSAVQLIAVDNTDALYKRSPTGEEEGFEVYRVPTVVVSRGGDEVARIVEHPVRSLEQDLLAILDGGGDQDGDAYQPSYPTYPVVQRWFRDGLLADPDVRADDLAQQVRGLASSKSEIESAARVLLLRGDVTEAVKLFEVNASLLWDSATSEALPAQRIADLEAELLAAEAAFAETFAAGDMDAFEDFLADGVVFVSGERRLRGKAAVVEAWTVIRSDADQAPFSWKPERVAVDASGREGISTGPVLLPDGTWNSSFVSTWTHTPAGWRILLDIGPRCPR